MSSSKNSQLILHCSIEMLAQVVIISNMFILSMALRYLYNIYTNVWSHYKYFHHFSYVVGVRVLNRSPRPDVNIDTTTSSHDAHSHVLRELAQTVSQARGALACLDVFFFAKFP